MHILLFGICLRVVFEERFQTICLSLFLLLLLLDLCEAFNEFSFTCKLVLAFVSDLLDFLDYVCDHCHFIGRKGFGAFDPHVQRRMSLRTLAFCTLSDLVVEKQVLFFHVHGVEVCFLLNFAVTVSIVRVGRVIVGEDSFER